MSSIAPFNLGTAPLLGWASQHGDPLDPRAAEAVVGLLALSGAPAPHRPSRTSPELVKELMLDLLPLYVSAIPAELAGYPAVLAALIGYTHEAGKLNAKRRDRLIAEVEMLRPRFEAAMTSQRRVTWARLYGQLLRAEGVDAADPQAVGAWVDALAGRPDPQRRAALGFEAFGGSGAGESGGVAPLASAAFARALTGERSRQARLLLAQRLESVVLSEQLTGHDGAPLVAGPRRTWRTRRSRARGMTPRPGFWRTAGRRPGWTRCCAGGRSARARLGPAGSDAGRGRGARRHAPGDVRARRCPVASGAAARYRPGGGRRRARGAAARIASRNRRRP